MISIRVEGLTGVERFLQNVDKDAQLANFTALKRTGAKARTLGRRDISRRFNIKQKILNKRMKVFPGKGRGGPPAIVRLWLGLNFAVTPEQDRRVLREFPGAFEATMPSGKRGHFVRRPNPLKRGPRSRHTDPSPVGKANPNYHALPIDRVRKRLNARQVAPILAREVRRATRELYARTFRQDLARRRARRARR